MQDGRYLSYTEYISYGGKLDKIVFLELEFEARKNIDIYTSGRLKKLQNQIEEVKRCIYKIIKVLENYSNERDRSITSENTDGYSINYNNDNLTENKKEEIYSIILEYLSECYLDDGTPYLYRGR